MNKLLGTFAFPLVTFIAVPNLSNAITPSNSIHETVDQIVRHNLSKHQTKKMKWDWEDAVMLLGLSEYGKSHPNAEIKNAIKNKLTDYHRQFQTKGLPQINRSDACPAALSAYLLKKDWNESAFLTNLDPVVHYLKNEPRNSLESLNHLGHWWVGALYPPSVWIDSMVMIGTTAIELGQGLNDRALLNFGLSQPLIISDALLDKKANMYKHAWFELTGRISPASNTYWLRGNGWALAALVRAIDAMPTQDPRRLRMIETVQAVSGAILSHQRSNGLWGTVINAKKSYDETSGTALVAYAMAHGYRQGYLPISHWAAAKRAYDGITRHYLKPVKTGLSLRGISGPTNPGPRINYMTIVKIPDKAYGVGAFLLLASELSALQMSQ